MADIYKVGDRLECMGIEGYMDAYGRDCHRTYNYLADVISVDKTKPSMYQVRNVEGRYEHGIGEDDISGLYGE